LIAQAIAEAAKVAENAHSWDWVTAIGTAAAAVFTAAMAWFTRQAIKEGQAQRREANEHYEVTRAQDRRHHEDAFRPLLVLTPADVMNPLTRQGVLFADPSDKTLLINCTVRNIGSGPALNIRLSVRGDGRRGFGPSRELTPMAAGDVLANRNRQVLIDVLFDDGFNASDLHNLPGGLWVLVLEYEDVFGNSFHTLHSKDQGERWTRAGRGCAP